MPLTRQGLYSRRRRAEAKAQGLCHCGSERQAGRMECPECIAYNRVWREEKNARLCSKQVCIRCAKNSAKPGCKHCQACLKCRADAYRTRFGRGMCALCSLRPSRAGMTTCPPCGMRRAAYHRDRRAQKRNANQSEGR